jgi:hypothetical protein
VAFIYRFDEWAIKNEQSRETRNIDEDYVGHHYTQANRNNVNKK